MDNSKDHATTAMGECVQASLMRITESLQEYSQAIEEHVQAELKSTKAAISEAMRKQREELLAELPELAEHGKRRRLEACPIPGTPVRPVRRAPATPATPAAFAAPATPGSAATGSRCRPVPGLVKKTWDSHAAFTQVPELRSLRRDCELVEDLGVEREVERFVLDSSQKWGVEATGLGEAVKSLLETLHFLRIKLRRRPDADSRSQLLEALKATCSSAWENRGCYSNPREWTRAFLVQWNLQLRKVAQREEPGWAPGTPEIAQE